MQKEQMVENTARLVETFNRTWREAIEHGKASAKDYRSFLSEWILYCLLKERPLKKRLADVRKESGFERTTRREVHEDMKAWTDAIADAVCDFTANEWADAIVGGADDKDYVPSLTRFFIEWEEARHEDEQRAQMLGALVADDIIRRGPPVETR